MRFRHEKKSDLTSAVSLPIGQMTEFSEGIPQIADGMPADALSVNRDFFDRGSAYQIIAGAGILCLLLGVTDYAIDTVLSTVPGFQPLLDSHYYHRIVDYAEAVIAVMALACYTLYLLKIRRRTEPELQEVSPAPAAAAADAVNRDGSLLRQMEELMATIGDLESFNYSASHDLRAPLSRILCSADALRKRYVEQLDDDGKFFLDNLELASRRMAEIIETMLDLARVSRTEMVRHEFDLGEMARDIFLELDRDLPLRKIEFSAPDGLMVTGDERMLRIALNNLMENALKFTRERDPALISLGVVGGSPEPVWYLRDNGVGFDMSQANRLFKPFNRLHGAEEFPGTGIGLAIVQRVIQRHGGAIWAESSPGEGATFYFTLPKQE